MDNIDNETATIHTISPHGNVVVVSEHFKNTNNTNTNTNTSTTSTLDTDADAEVDTSKHRHCVSLPLYYDQVSCAFEFRIFLNHKIPRVSDEIEEKTETN